MRQQHRKSMSPLQKKSFNSDMNRAINLLVYGCEVLKYNKSNKKPIRRIYYIYDEDQDYLQYLHPSKKYVDTRICLLDIVDLKDAATCEDFKTLSQDTLLQITFSKKKHVLMFKSTQLRDLFWQGLQYFIELSTSGVGLEMRQSFLSHDQNHNKVLEFNEVKALMRQLQLNIRDDELQQQFSVLANQEKNINYTQYKILLSRLIGLDQWKSVFNQYASGDFMSKQQFHAFLRHQKESQDMFLQFSSIQGDGSYKMTFDQFTSYLFSQYNSLFLETKQVIYQSKDHPLTDYWINSSHNTYLMNNQLTGESSVQAYINAFQKGCRCVELDCWDGSNNTPIIFHGYTMTSKISFESVIQTIQEYAFKYSQNPLILSLEVHCCVKQQDIMADIMTKYLYEFLLLLPDDYLAQDYFPTLAQLQRKILIKHRGNLKSSLEKRGRFDLPDQYSTQQETRHTFMRQKMIEDIQIIEEAQIEEEFVPLKRTHSSYIQTTLKPKYRLNNMTSSFAAYVPNPRVFDSHQPVMKTEEEEEVYPDRQKKSKVEESKKMSAITCLFGCSLKAKSRCVYEISSLEELKVNLNMVQFHRKYFSRIYPAGSRVDSSNYDPIQAFNSGAQIVALNFQTNDIPMLLNQCKFMENGGLNSGYVLKPAWMRSAGKKTIADFQNVIFRVQITVICGYYLKPLETQNNIISPQVKVTLRGMITDELTNSSVKSQIVKWNGLNPVFNMNFSIELRCPDLAILLFEVRDFEKLIGWMAVPVSCLGFGYRCLNLLNQFLKPIPNSCLMILVQ